MENPAPPTSSRGWRIARRLLIAFAILITLAALLYTEQNLHGYLAWAACKRKCAAAGIDLNYKSFVPAPVPDDENFAMTPFLAPLLDLNPEPLQPGQSAWRDTNAYQKTVDFAKDFMPAFNSMPSHGPENPMPDLVALAKALHKEAKTPVPDYPSRAAAAEEILRTFKPYAPVLDELRTALARPYSRFNIHYDDADPTGILLPHLAQVKKVALIFAWRAAAELAAGNRDAAYEDLQTALSLVDTLRGEPFMISHLVRIAMLNIAERVVWEGLAEHAWSDQQLEKLEDRLSKFTILADSQLALRFELAAHGVVLFDYLRNTPTRQVAIDLSMNGAETPMRLLPSGWFRLEQTSYVSLMSEMILAGYDAKSGLVHPKAIKEAQRQIIPLFKSPASVIWHHRVISGILLPATDKFYQKSAYGQTCVSEAAVACALERYRMANGQLPATLDALTPKFLAAVPTDIINGEPLKYEPTGANQFKLYSVGWNETDDHGQMGLQNHTLDLTTGDWVWVPYPEK